MTLNLVQLLESANLRYQLSLLARILLACILGYLIGYERTSRDKNAGMRTHAIVCMGSALLMVVSKYGFRDEVNFDASRVAAQIVSGIGFLGAGVIFVKNNMVSGLTTAAGIWATAGVGMAIGAGSYLVGIGSGILLVGIQVLLHRISFLANEPFRGYLKITTTDYEAVLDEIQEQFKKEKIRMVGMKVNKSRDEIKLEFDLLYPPRYEKAVLLDEWARDTRINGIAG